MPRFTVSHAVFFLALLLAVCVYSLMVKYGLPQKIAWGSAILCILAVAIFWSAINLNLEDDDEDN